MEDKIKTVVWAVDDDDSVLYIIKDEFRNDGEVFIIKYFLESEEFLKEIEMENLELDLVIIDINMPGFDILEAIEKITRIIPSCYIIVLSGETDPTLITEIQNKHHIWGYVIKNGFWNKELREVVSGAHEKILIRKNILSYVK